MPISSSSIRGPTIPGFDFDPALIDLDARQAEINQVLRKGPCFEGIWAEHAHTLHPDQWVRVWLINLGFPDDDYGLCQVKDLMSVVDTDSAPFDEYAVQPCAPEGNVIAFEPGLEPPHYGYLLC